VVEPGSNLGRAENKNFLMKISAKIKIHNVKLCSMGGGGKAPISLPYSILLPNQILIVCMSRNKVFTHIVQKIDIE
jgi:hypothetical protein